jgi:hypothetical protein
MTKPLPRTGRFALLLLLPFGLLSLAAPHRREALSPRIPKFADWTTRHSVYTQFGTSAAIEAARRDPRALMRWREVEERELSRRQANFRRSNAMLQFGFHGIPIRRFPSRQSPVQIDWSVNLGTTGTANNMYPAKYTFNITTNPDCTKDFIVFPINATGGAGQANILAFNNLYSGGANGFCGTRATPPGDTDTKTLPTVMWSYNVHAIAAGAAVPTSPVLSFDGTKVAFVESASGNAAHFHVLAWRSGDTGSTNLQTTTSPVAITSFVSTNPVATATTGVATDLVLGSATTGTDTLSSPYIDYSNDLAYVGNDIGVLYRVKNVFCTLTSCGGAAPSIDSSWGTGGAVSVCTGKLTGPVLDFFNMNVYVGCSDGKLYSISQSGTVTSLAVGDGIASKAFGGIVDPPIVDALNGWVYAVSGSAAGGAHGVLVQTKPDFSSTVAVPIGNGNQCNLHAPALSNAYFTSPTATGSLIYIGGVTGTVGTCTASGATGGTAVLYGATFGAGGVLTSGAPTNSLASGNPVGSEYAPVGEFFNSVTGQDLLFVGLLRSAANGFADLYTFNITTGWSATVVKTATEGFGTSGMVFDNQANTTTYPQASSVYFNAVGENATCSSNTANPFTPGTQGCAVKLTQAGLQ